MGWVSGVGYDADFCWLRVKFLETVSSSRPSNNQEISRKAVLLFLSRLKKSGIEYVILAGSSLFTLSAGNPDMSRVWRLPGGAQCAIFSMLLTFFHLKLQIFAGPQGHLYVSDGSEGSRGVPRG